MELLTKARASGEENDRERRNFDLAWQAACQCAVLLKNDGALPFQDKCVALYGAGASRTIRGGTGSGEVNERHSVSILEGLERRGFQVTTRRWIAAFEAEYQRAYDSYLAQKSKRRGSLSLRAMLNQMAGPFRMPAGRPITQKDLADSATENCVYVLSRQAGEGGDRRLEPGDYYLTGEELAAIRFCAGHYRNFVLIVNCGSPVELTELQEDPNVNAILYISQLGSAGGLAVADLLSGAASPSGKLADSWARWYDDLPFAREYGALNGNLDDEYYKEGIYVGYRYFDSFGVEPLYPFGFGLGYSRFSLQAPKVTVEGQTVKVKLRVRNTGRKYAGRETVQLYVSPPAGKLDKEYQRLAAFAKTGLLAPGRSQTLELRFELSALASFRFDDASFILEPGDYILRLGVSSRSTEALAALRLEREAVVSRHEHVCPAVRPFLELEPPARREEPLGDLPVIPIDPGCIPTRTFSYEPPAPCGDERVRRFVSGLSVRDMTELVVGAGYGGTSRFVLPGAAGNTSSAFWDRGLANVALCDGPAGLRIQQRSVIGPEGRPLVHGHPLSALEAMPKALRKRLQPESEGRRVLYQYTTAFPVASALAQSWDRDLLYRVGQAVFEEMKEYGCTFWLAPAVNLHRNPLCGRNFEYYSEDPFLCGSLAAALTRGVQQEEGYAVTVKHFACNNQEDNRNSVSSNVKERALRELYLPAFQLVIRQGGARAVMSSYNRLNGVYTPDSYDLCTKVLRCEWGFDGVVMTDWLSTLFLKDASALAIAAGNDLIMPGEPLSKLSILHAVRTGRLSRQALERCCENVVKAILASPTQREYLG